MRTRDGAFRGGLWRWVALATVGVVLTTLIVGYGASRILGLGLMEGMLIGAIIGSSDSAAVSSLLHAAGRRPQTRGGATRLTATVLTSPTPIFLPSSPLPTCTL